MPAGPKFGIRPHHFIDADETIGDLADWVVRAEALGFDSVHPPDRLVANAEPVYHSTSYEPVVTLATYAARTERIKVGPMIYVVPYRHPLHVAKVFGTLDLASEGRVILGVGAGWYAPEFEALDVPRSKRGQMLEESVEIVKRIWTEDHVSYDGEVYAFSDVTIEPKPLQDPHPPIWFGSFGPEVEDFTRPIDRALERIGRLGDGWAPLIYSAGEKRMMDPGLFREAWDRIAAGAETHGRDPDDLEIVFSHWVYVMEDEDAEREDCMEALGWWFDGTFEEAKETYLIGEPEEIVSKIEAVTARLPRVDRFTLGTINYDYEQMDRLADRVLPLLERAY